jgi:hypothetical protein
VQKLPCFLCGRQLDRRTDKNDKSYFVCDACGTQIFIRRKTGIENLNELIRTLKGRDLPFREHARVLYKIQAVLAEIRGIKKEIKALDGELGLFSRDPSTGNSGCFRETKIRSANAHANCSISVSKTC